MAGRRFLVFKQNISEKNILGMCIAVAILFLVFLLLINRLTQQLATDTAEVNDKVNVQKTTTRMIKEEVPVFESEQNTGSPDQNIAEAQLKSESRSPAAHKEIIYEMPVTQKFLLQ